MCVGGGLHTVMLLDTCALFLLKKLARLVAVAHGRAEAFIYKVLKICLRLGELNDLDQTLSILLFPMQDLLNT